jgi:hypothetical protein
MSRAQFFERERTEDIEDRRYACSCIVVCLILYFIMFIIDNSLWHSYVKSSCFVVNSTIVERQCCLQYQSNSVFEAVWVLNVHPNGSHSTQYLADIRQKFDNYYEAYEAILTLNLVSIDLYQFDRLICTFFRLVLSNNAMYTQRISLIYAGLVHRLKESSQHYSVSALFFSLS